MWFKIIDQKIELYILAKPNAKQSKLLSVEERLHITLHACPREDDANQELIRYLSKLLKIPKSSIALKQGCKSRYKTVILPMNEKIEKFIIDPIKFIE
jgi:uncharacterized protein YggU (UPF0235/DUF167 family)